MKTILKFLAVLLVKYLQKKYKTLTLSKQDTTNQFLNKLILIQSVLYYLKNQFEAWGYFHPDCIWTEQDEVYFRKLFPEKDFYEIDVVVWHNPEAVTYYHNKIWTLKKGQNTDYHGEIRGQLKRWKKWN